MRYSTRQSIWGSDLDGIGGRMAGAWSSLLSAVRTGRPAYHEVFGQPFWEDLTAHPDVAASFDAMMGPAGHGVPDPDVLLSGDWSGVRSVVDVGGGTGSLLAAILRAHPASAESSSICLAPWRGRARSSRAPALRIA